MISTHVVFILAKIICQITKEHLTRKSNLKQIINSRTRNLEFMSQREKD